MAIKLYPHQEQALKRMKCGCILNGGVGSGKTITSLAFYHLYCGGQLDPFEFRTKPKNLIVITTAKKRDSLEWEEEMLQFHISPNPEFNHDDTTVIIDSWNNIKKYAYEVDYFFIFDEDKVCGKGAWVKAFQKIAKNNFWMILSATSGDCWMDYVPVFIANGFYKNITEFRTEHVEYDPYVTKFPKIKGYHNTRRLERLRDNILVDMDFERHTERILVDIYCDYDKRMYNQTWKDRWDPFNDEPFTNAAAVCYALRKINNSDDSRVDKVLDIFDKRNRVIIFYNFDYELEILRGINYGDDVEIAEWNGHKHQEIPTTDKWVYLVQYTSGAEGWNCITTDTIIFFSQNYSYKVVEQAMGRIDRLNTPFRELYYYTLKSHSPIDLAIARALKEKKKFNESRFVGN